MFRQPPMKCKISSLSYDFDARMGRVHFRKGEFPRMESCVDAFLAIDMEVARIQTYSGGVADAAFEKSHKGWTAHIPPRMTSAA